MNGHQNINRQKNLGKNAIIETLKSSIFLVGSQSLYARHTGAPSIVGFHPLSFCRHFQWSYQGLFNNFFAQQLAANLEQKPIIWKQILNALRVFYPDKILSDSVA
jgi:hypothetical protein